MPLVNRTLRFLSGSFEKAENGIKPALHDKNTRGETGGDDGAPSMEREKCSEEAQSAITYGEWVCLAEHHHHHH